jgi:hypothetical protein
MSEVSRSNLPGVFDSADFQWPVLPFFVAVSRRFLAVDFGPAIQAFEPLNGDGDPGEQVIPTVTQINLQQ